MCQGIFRFSYMRHISFIFAAYIIRIYGKNENWMEYLLQTDSMLIISKAMLNNYHFMNTNNTEKYNSAAKT